MRATPFRAAAWLCFSVCTGLHSDIAILAQGMVAPGQQMWINPQPMVQVGPNGAVNLDQSQPYTAAQFPPAAYPPQQYTAQPYATQPWGPQAATQQPAWGMPWTPQTNVAGPAPYFFLHRTSLFGEFLYIRPRNAEVAYALPIEEPPLLDPDIEPVGPVAVIDPEYEPAFRVGGNLAVSDGNSIAAQYTRIRSSTTSATSVVEGAVLYPLVGIPEELSEIEFESASALLDIELDLIDVDFRGLWAGCECNNYAFAVNYLGGVQFAKLDQTFNANLVEEDDGETEVTSVNSAINFEGIGMRLGLQGERFFPNSGLFVYGNGITSVLFGEFDATFRQVEPNDDDDLPNFTSWNAGRVVPVVDLELGGGWLGMNRHLRLSAGYRVSAWFNVVKTEDWLRAVQNNEYRDLDGTLTFDGLVARAEWIF